jgi:hypothetical protein
LRLNCQEKDALAVALKSNNINNMRGVMSHPAAFVEIYSRAL